jgi:integrase/recombinase XerC
MPRRQNADVPDTELGRLARDFLADLTAEGCSRSTTASYRSALYRTVLMRADVLEDLTPSLLRSVLADMREAGIGASTIVTRHAILTSFCTWLVEQHLVAESPMARIPRPRAPKPEHRYLTEAQVAAVYQAADADPNDRLAKKYGALVRVLYESGMRIGELRALRWRDVDFDRREIRVRNGKGAKSRRVTVSDDTFAALQALDRTGEFVFNRVSASGTRNRLAVIGARAGIPSLAPHDFRRSMATNWCLAGGDTLALQQLLGHADIATTAHYARSQLANVALDHSRKIDLASRLKKAQHSAVDDDMIDALLAAPDMRRRLLARLLGVDDGTPVPEWMRADAQEGETPAELQGVKA